MVIAIDYKNGSKEMTLELYNAQCGITFRIIFAYEDANCAGG